MIRALGTALVLLAAQENAALPPDWRTAQDLAVPRPSLVSLELPLETLDAARPDLGDLRIVDPSGRDVPWAPERPAPPRSGPRTPASVKTFLRKESTEVVIETGMEEPLAGVEIDVASLDFIKAARVEESDDGKIWKAVREDEPLFSAPGGARKTAIELPAGRRGYLRVILDDRPSHPVPITAARILQAAPPPPRADPLEVSVVERREEKGRTRFFLRFPGRHARLAEVSIETPEPVFLRQVELSFERDSRKDLLAEGTIYRTLVEGHPPSERRAVSADVRLPLRDAVLTIRNGDSPPLRVERIRARVRPVRIFFAAPAGGVYRLLAGNPVAKAPRYDVAALGEGGTEGSAIVPGPLRANPAWRPPEPLPGVAWTGAPIDVSAWRFRKEVHLGPGGIHELELDPDVLSAADPGGEDVRLVRGGVQVPFLRDDPPRIRPLSLTPTKEESVRNERASRWALPLPRARLPVRRIACSAKEALFRREVRLIEGVRDELGVPERVVLGRALWSRTPDQAPERLELELERPPRGDRLILEVDDGDNPPLELGAFEAFYAAPRLLFKAESRPGLYLYYGNRKASPPRYDLAVLSSELASSERAPSTLGPEEPRTPSARSEEDAGKFGGIFLWSVLAIVTFALVMVIVRLLPPRAKEQERSAP